jgi:hypothetical protein
MNLVTKWVKGRVETGGLEVVAKDMPNPAGADLIYVLTARIACTFSDLEVISDLLPLISRKYYSKC